MSEGLLNLVDSGVVVKIALGREEIEKMEREKAAESKLVELQPKKQGKRVKSKKEKKIKYYAVKEARGIRDEIFTDWGLVEYHFAGSIPVYKSFDTLEEAEEYLKNVDLDNKRKQVAWCIKNKEKMRKREEIIIFKEKRKSHRGNKKKKKNKKKIKNKTKKNKYLTYEDIKNSKFELDAEMKEIFDRIDNRQFDGLFDKFK